MLRIMDADCSGIAGLFLSSFFFHSLKFFPGAIFSTWREGQNPSVLFRGSRCVGQGVEEAGKEGAIDKTFMPCLERRNSFQEEQWPLRARMPFSVLVHASQG